MEISGTVFRLHSSFIGGGIEVNSNSCSKPSVSFGDIQLLGSRGAIRKITKFSSNSGFSDNGHMQYYSQSTRVNRCGSGKISDQATKAEDKSVFKEEKKMMKMKMKMEMKKKKKILELVEGLSRDLDNHGLVDQVRGEMVSEATELLLGQLQQLKAGEEELKRKKKEEKAKLKAATHVQKRLKCELTSSSSSSSTESSDSECGEVVDMSSLKSQSALTPPTVDKLQPVMKNPTLQLQNKLTQEASTIEHQSVSREAHATLTIPSTINQKGVVTEEEGIIGSCLRCIEQPFFTTRTSTSTNCDVGMAGGGASLVEKVEVCMGGKCKKSGAAALLDEFQRVLGAEASVVGCKCMGKCRDGPNVRVLNNSSVEADCRDDFVRVPTNPLCIGVGFEDVGAIAANFLAKKHKESGLAAAS